MLNKYFYAHIASCLLAFSVSDPKDNRVRSTGRKSMFLYILAEFSTMMA